MTISLQLLVFPRGFPWLTDIQQFPVAQLQHPEQTNSLYRQKTAKLVYYLHAQSAQTRHMVLLFVALPTVLFVTNTCTIQTGDNLVIYEQNICLCLNIFVPCKSGVEKC